MIQNAIEYYTLQPPSAICVKGPRLAVAQKGTESAALVSLNQNTPKKLFFKNCVS